MSEDEAQRRCRAARLARQFPALLPMLAEASIHLTGILLIGPLLTPENQEDLLARVRFRTKREIERIVAELAPAPAAPARIELLCDARPQLEETLSDAASPPRPRNTWAAYVRALAGPIRELPPGTGDGQAPPAALPESSADLSAGPPLRTSDAVPTPSATRSEPRYRIQFTADQDFVDLLEEARELLQHSLRRRDLVEVQRRALQALVKKLRSRRFGATDRPRASEPATADDPSPGAPTHAANRAVSHAPTRKAPQPETAAPARRRHAPAAVRRAVWQRDDARCSYTDARGQRCRERAALEFHHQEPHACGGPASIDNLTLRCRAHNTLAAEQDFGRAWMAQKRQQARERRKGSPR